LSESILSIIARHALEISASVLQETTDTPSGKTSRGRSENSSMETGSTSLLKEGIHSKNVPASLATLSVKPKIGSARPLSHKSE